MKLLARLLLVIALAMTGSPGYASQAPIPQPVVGPHSMADLAVNFLNPALAALESFNKGPSAPVSPVLGMGWINDTSTVWVVSIYDGASWVSIGTIDSTAHVYGFAATALPAFTGDVASPAGSSVTTLATVNASPGTYGSATLSPVIVVNGKGLATTVTTATIAPPFSAVTGQATLAQLPNLAADTVLANATVGVAVPTAFAMPSCSTSANALNYTTSTGIGCNTAVNAATLSGATMASPGAIGGGTPAAMTGTTITANTSFAGPLNGTVGATTPNSVAATTVSATGQISSTLATGTAPLSITSTTQVPNLYVARAALADVATTTTTNANLTGPVTSVGNATSVTANAVTNAMAAQMPTLTIKGNNTGGTANALDLTVANVNTMINSTVAPVFANNTAKPTTLAGYGITDGESTFTATAAVSAAGTTQGTATAITKTSDHQLIEVTTTGASAGVVLPTSTASSRFVVTNRGANALSIYPASTGTIDQGAASVAVTLGVNQTMIIVGKDVANNWYTNRAATYSATAPPVNGTATVGTSNDLARSDHVHPAADLSTTTQVVGVLGATHFPALTGDVTTSSGALASTIAANAVTNAKAAQMAANTLKGNNTGSTANAADITMSQALDSGIGSTQGQIAYRNASTWVSLAPGVSGQVLQTGGAAANPSWFTVTGTGTVTSTSVVSANGFAGTVANPTTTPAITLSTTVTGVLKGNGTAISAGTAGTDYSAGTNALTTGILKSTTTTGALSIAVGADIPAISATTQLTGTVQAAQFPALTGDCTTTAGALAVTCATVGTSTKGMAPSSGGGTTNFLRADGTWAAPAAGSSFTSTAAISAAGTTQGTATALTSTSAFQTFEVTTVAAGTGIVLPTATGGLRLTVVNRGANPLKIYPASTGTIDGGSASAAISIQPKSSIVLVDKDATNDWYTAVTVPTKHIQVVTSGVTWTSNANSKYEIVSVVGGGGGGGGTNPAANGAAASGGGAGGVAVKLYITLPSTAYTIAIGGAGVAGGAGGNTTFTDGSTLITGGGGGAGVAGGTSTAVAGGAGGTATNGDYNIAGNPGGNGVGTATTPAAAGGHGGQTLFGPGGKAAAGATANGAAPVSGFGGGGGGGTGGVSTSGGGTAGAIIIEEWY